MAAARGRESDRLSDRLFQEPFAFDFFQAVRVLEHLACARTDGEMQTAPLRLGLDQPPDLEVVRFRSLPSLSFPISSIAHLRPFLKDEAAKLPLAEMMVAFMGLTGPTGVLPHHYTALLLRRIRDKDFSLRDFQDLFHHRLVTLFHRAGVKYRLPFVYERSKLESFRNDDLITWSLYCLVGMGTGGLRDRLQVNDQTLLYYSGHFAHYPRSAAALQAILSDYFAVPIHLDQLQEQWLKIPRDEQTRMPGSIHGLGLHNQLGADVVVGDRTLDVQSKFRLRIGPVTYAEFQSFMPNGNALQALCELARRYVGPELDFDVQLLLKAEEVPQTQLGADSQLGWNTWMPMDRAGQPADEAVFSLDQI